MTDSTTADNTSEHSTTRPAAPLDAADPASIRRLRALKALRLVRMVLPVVVAADALFQALLAGKFLAGNYDSLGMHSANAMTLAALTLGLSVVELMAWRLHVSSIGPALMAAGLLAATIAQIAVGEARILQLHVPLGVLIIALTGALAVRALRSETPAEPGR